MDYFEQLMPYTDNTTAWGWDLAYPRNAYYPPQYYAATTADTATTAANAANMDLGAAFLYATTAANTTGVALRTLATQLNEVGNAYGTYVHQLRQQINAAYTTPFVFGANEWATWTVNAPGFVKPQPLISKRAVARAKKLIREHLTAEQLEMLAKQDYFELESSSGRRYRIRRGHSMNVYLLDKAGRPVERLCAYARQAMPDEDHMLHQALYLQTDEEEFRRIANIAPLGDVGFIAA